MEQIVLFSIPAADLQALIARSVTESLKAHQPASPPPTKAAEEYLTREETRKLLRISIVTLRQLELRGELKAVRIARRVLYRRSDVERSLRVGGGQ